MRAARLVALLAFLPPALHDAVRYTDAHGGQVLLGGDWTLRGKVLVGLAAPTATPAAEWPLHVVYSAQLRATWADEAQRRLGPAVPVAAVAHEADGRLLRAARPRCVFVTSYALLYTLPTPWLRRARAVVAGESHKLRNGRSA